MSSDPPPSADSHKHSSTSGNSKGSYPPNAPNSPRRYAQHKHQRSESQSSSRHSPRRISDNYSFQAPHPPYGLSGALGATHHRSDSSISISRGYNGSNSPRSITGGNRKSLGTRTVSVGSSNNSSPPLGHGHGDSTTDLLENDQDMVDLTAEMALLNDDDYMHDDDYDSRSEGRYIGSRVLTSGSGKGGLRPLSLGLAGGPKGPKGFVRDQYGHSRGLSTDSFYRDDDEVDNERSGQGSSSISEKLAADYGTSGNKSLAAIMFWKRKHNLATWDTFIYRLRFCLRLLSLIASGFVTISFAQLTELFTRTKGNKDSHGAPIWPPHINLVPTNLVLAGAVIATGFGLFWTILSVKRAVKMVIGGWMTLAAIFSTLLTMGISIGTIIYCSTMKRNEAEDRGTLFCVCNLAKNPPNFTNNDSRIHFQFHCGELRIGWYTSWAIAITDFLILITIIAGWLLRWWNVGGRKAGNNFWSAPPIAEARSIIGRRGLGGLRV